ncbi:guanylate kinase, partial [bacterium]|nr:guanylate kinase [bacterium]
MSPENKYDLPEPNQLIIVLSGLSGVGKDTVLKHIQERGCPFHFVVTVTTRPPREGEVHGRDYWFVSKEEFFRMLEAGELMEHATVYDEYKGIPKRQVQEALASGKDVVLRLDVQGAETIRKLVPEALLIFLTTESEEELVSRLKARRTETEEKLKLRIDTAREELRHIGGFDYFVVNPENQLDETVDKIISIIDAEHCRVKPRKVD